MDQEKIKLEIECDVVVSDPFEKNIVLERYEFYRRSQRSEESFYTFLEDIRNLAENCEFHGEEKEFLIRDRFIFGINDKSLQSAIITNGGNPSVEKVLEICQKFNTYSTIYIDNNIIKVEELDEENESANDRSDDGDKSGDVDGKDSSQSNSSMGLNNDLNNVTVKIDENKRNRRFVVPKTIIKDKKIKQSNKSSSSSRRILSREDAKFTCSICGRVFNDIRYFQGHLVSHSINNDANKTNNSKELAQMNQFSFQCSVCEQEYSNIRYFRGHMVQHTIPDGMVSYQKGEKYKCAICNNGKKTYENHEKLILHYASHVRGNKSLAKVRCKICGKLSAVGSLRKHMVLHVSNVQFQISCQHQHCDKKFTTYAQLSRHKKIHDEYQQVVCDICGKEFHRPLYLQIHKNKVHPSLDSKIEAVECYICKKRVNSIPTLKVHLYWHSLVPDHLCTQCGERFRKGSLLKRHLMRADHNGENMKKFQCHICGIRCYDKTQADQHKLVHTRERPYVCHYENCTKSYAKKMALRDHLRTHTGEKPFHCQLCLYKGSSRTLLRTHMLVHTGRHKKN